MTNTNLEGIFFRKMEYSALRKWLKNISRLSVVILAVFVAVTFYYSLHKILGLTGVLLGSIVVLVMPALIHQRHVAESTSSKCFDIFLVVYAVLAIVVLGSLIVFHWND